MKECAADLSKVYGVSKVDAFPDSGRLQGSPDLPGDTEESMADEERTLNGATDRSAESGRRLAGFAAGMVFGALIGAGIALMFAPESGEKTRRRLRRRLERLREETAEGLERAGASTRRDLARRRKRLEAGLERAADRARDIL
jgi:hypothetical protein